MAKQPIIFDDMKERAATGAGDPFFTYIRDNLAQMSVVPAGLTHTDGKLDSQTTAPPGRLDPKEIILAAVFGCLVLDNQIGLDDDRFNRAIAAALAEYAGDKARFDKALKIMIKAGTTPTEIDVRAGL